MKYALLIYETPGANDGIGEDERQSVSDEYMAIAQEAGVYGGAQLQPIETATTVRVNGGAEPLTTDGPFAETKEVFGGFYLVEADDIDKALELAARIPAARMGGSVEVRPIVDR
jgi:hypothetical protein